MKPPTGVPIILIADDNLQNVELLDAYLAGVECEIITANDGEETLRAVEEYKPDLILLDVMMPKLSGFEVCKKIRANPATRDVLILMGTTLIVSVVTPRHDPVDGYWVMPFTEPNLFLAGGASNAGGLFINWATRTMGADSPGALPTPDRVPVWAPYPRGERVPLHDPHRRGMLADLDLMHDAVAIRRASFEASGFVARRMIDAAAAHGIVPRRIIATGGGTRVDEWVHAVADCTGLPVQCTAVPEGAALGSAFLARLAAGLEDGVMTDARRWARAGRTVDPDPAWADPLEARYQRFLALSAV